jgi:hypothetical protein
MKNIPPSLKVKVPFLVAGFLSFLFSVFLYFVKNEEMAGIFVGLWVPSIHSLGTLLVSPVDAAAPTTAVRETVTTS